MFRSSRALLTAAILTASFTASPPAAIAAQFSGGVTDRSGAPVEGVLVSFSAGDPTYTMTVYSAADGHFDTGKLGADGPFQVRARRIGWKDIERREVTEGAAVALVLERETDPAAVANQLPANRWYGLVLDRIEDETKREQLVRQCTYCHQQGNWATRVHQRPRGVAKVLSLMARMGGLPVAGAARRSAFRSLFNECLRPEPRRPGSHRAGWPSPASRRPRRPRCAESDPSRSGSSARASMQHDLMRSFIPTAGSTRWT